MEHDHMVQALTPNGTNHPLDVGSLPGERGVDKTSRMPMRSDSFGRRALAASALPEKTPEMAPPWTAGCGSGWAQSRVL
jgi:hypothetical protein